MIAEYKNTNSIPKKDFYCYVVLFLNSFRCQKFNEATKTATDSLG